ncbi:hypothetical protein ABEF95_016657 [Exophiala dermatitidis]
MVELIPPPDPHTLLPPLLACLPTSYASTRPPPALLDLLSPILRQRLDVHTSLGNRENWAGLLCWNAEQGEVLKSKIEETEFEPHPSSGEIEVGELSGRITYKRFDDETLQARIPLADWPFTAVYLWCPESGQKQNSGAPLWKLAELLPSDNSQPHNNIESSSWSTSIGEANESARERLVTEALQEADAANARAAATFNHHQRTLLSPPMPHGTDNNDNDNDEDDDYWAMYDKTPGRTPARKASVEPPRHSNDDDYYARYGDVQPALDNHDPDEEMEIDNSKDPADTTSSTLTGNTLQLQQFLSHGLDGHTSTDPLPPPSPPLDGDPPPYQDEGSSDEHEGLDAAPPANGEKEIPVSHPVPSSPSSRGSETVARLEEHAERYTASEIGIRQHISTSLKSMYRLARSAGMDRDEFERIVQRELETLSIFDRDG